MNMDRFLMMESQLIKFEVEENQNFHCIVCKAEFLSRSERNEHLETHFVHRNCKDCCRQVIVIGDLEFELHHPIHCKQSETIEKCEFETDDLMYEDTSLNDLENDVSQNEMRIESEGIDKEKELCTSPDKKVRPVPKIRKKSQKIDRKSKRIIIGNRRQSNIKNEKLVENRKAETDSEDDVVKEMDVALKKRRKQYAKLPKTVPCSMCDAMFGTERTLKIHMHQVHGIKERYICPICSREFKIGGNLKQHIETHSDYKRFICNYSGKGFHLPYNLKEHMNVHTGARPYKCETCGKTFGRNTLRQVHMRIHTGEKPYRYTEENCDRAYAYQTDLKRHRRSVHGIITKTFPCPICSKVFYENKFLTKHMHVHQQNA